MKLFSILFITVVLSCVAHLSAQEMISMLSKTNGLSAGVGFAYLSFRDDVAHPSGAESGPGFAAHIQYGFTHKFAGALAIQHYFVVAKSENKYDNSYPYSEVDVMARFFFSSTNSKLRPKLEAGATYTRMKESYYNFNTGSIQEEIYGGIGFAGGLGLSYFIKPELSADLSFLIHSGYFSTTLVDRVQFDVQHSYYTYNGILGLSYHF